MTIDGGKAATRHNRGDLIAVMRQNNTTPALLVPAGLAYWRRWRTFLCGLLVVLGVLVLVVILLGKFWILPNIDRYRPDLEKHLTARLARTVTIGHIQGGWRGLHPQLTIERFELHDAAGQVALAVPRIEARLSWESVWAGELRFASINLSALVLQAERRLDGKFEVGGFVVDPNQPRQANPPWAQWLLHQQEIVLQHTTLQWRDQLRQSPWLPLEVVTFALRNRQRNHAFDVQIQSPVAQGQQLRLEGNFRHPFFSSNLTDFKQWEGEISLNGHALNVAAWRPWLPLDPVQNARGNVQLRFGINQGRVERLSAGLALTELMASSLPLPLQTLGQTAAAQSSTGLAFKKIQGHVDFYRDDEGYSLHLQRLVLETTAGQHWQEDDLRLRWRQNATGQNLGGELEAAGLNLFLLTALSPYLPLSATLHEKLTHLAPRGHLSALKVKWALHEAVVAKNLQGLDAFSMLQWRTEFRGLGVNSLAAESLPISPLPSQAQSGLSVAHVPLGQPGIEGLSGYTSGTLQNGELMLDSKAAALTLPGVFEEPKLLFDRLNARIRWTYLQPAQQLTVNVDQAQFEAVDAAGGFTGQWQRNAATGGPGLLTLTGGLTRAAANRVWRYLPLTLPIGVRNWLQAALQAGHSEDMRFKVNGDLRQFPFAHSGQTGEFKVWGRVEDVVLNYGAHAAVLPALPSAEESQTWPHLQGVKADLLFDRARMEIHSPEAKVYNVNLQDVVATIPQLGANAVLEIKGNATGPAQDMLSFVQQSPLRTATHEALDKVQAQGTSQLALNLTLPLSQLNNSTVAGQLTLNHNDVVWAPGWPTLAQTTGKIYFTKQGFEVQALSGNAVGGTLKINSEVAASRLESGSSVLRFEGVATAAGMAPYLPGTMAQRLEGAARYAGKLTLQPAQGPALMLESDLQGLGLNFPAPLHKNSNAVLPLKLMLQPQQAAQNGDTGRPHDLVSFNLGRQLAARFELAKRLEPAALSGSTAPTSILRGAIAINEAPELPEEGVIANLNLPLLDLDAWRQVLKDFSGPRQKESSTGVALPALDIVAVRAKQVSLAGKQLDNVVLGASRNGQTWQLNIDSAQVAGYATWQMAGLNTPFGVIKARLARLVIPKVESATDDTKNWLEQESVEGVPGIDLVADQFEVSGRALGRLEVDAVNSRSARVWTLRKLMLTTPEANLVAQGSWGPDSRQMALDAPRQTRLSLDLSYNNLGALLDRLGLQRVMRRGAGTVSGTLNWQGLPYLPEVKSLSGQLSLSADKGQFLKAEPGLAKLLGVLSLQSLPRRITLDFRDVFSQGFAFDTVRANVAIDAGKASTQDFKMKGVNATVVMAGSADLAEETQALRVLVLPEVNAGTASILYGLVINPAIGFGTFLAQMVLRSPLRKALSFEYSIDGPWVEPVVTRVQRKNTHLPLNDSSRAADKISDDPAADMHTPVEPPAVSATSSAETVSDEATPSTGFAEAPTSRP